MGKVQLVDEPRGAGVGLPIGPGAPAFSPNDTERPLPYELMSSMVIAAAPLPPPPAETLDGEGRGVITAGEVGVTAATIGVAVTEPVTPLTMIDDDNGEVVVAVVAGGTTGGTIGGAKPAL